MEYITFSLIELVARAGGGGSSGGGGGGGGAEIIALVGYIPSYYLGKAIKKWLPRKAELIVSGATALVCSLTLLIIGFTGGFSSTYLMIMIIIGIWTGWSAAFFGLWERLQKRAKQASQAVQQASTLDSTWNERELIARAEQLFLQFQYDWSMFRVDSIATYTTASFAERTKLHLNILTELKRKNLVADIQIKQLLIVDAYDDPYDTHDTFTVMIEASALDQIISPTNEILFSTRKPFTEFWRFTRSDSTWILDSITQSTQNNADANRSLQQFATINGMYYSLDMGWLFLPSAGVLMSKGAFGKSDINNHVVGTYKGRLTQLYTYTPSPKQSSTSFLVMQVTLPKSYEGIIVQQKKHLFATRTFTRPPRSYTKYTFEWPDFNKRYDVRATNADTLAAFELINPGFMAYLYDNDPGIGIEVAGSVLYLFKPLGESTTTTIHRDEYARMLTITLKAFKELKL